MTSQLQSIEFTPLERINIVLSNVIKMLISRKLLDPTAYIKEQDYNNTLDKLDISTYKFENIIDKSQIIVKIMQQKITSVSKNVSLLEFLSKYDEAHKILIALDISPKTQRQIIAKSRNTEIFLESELMMNIIDYIHVPKHELLNDKEKEAFLASYDCKKKLIPRMFAGDPISRYYRAKVGDIFRITRPSETTCFSITYRIVV